MSEVALATRGLSFAYGGGQRALEDITLEVPRGSMVGIIGPNGGGKSTLIKALLGLVDPQLGRGRSPGPACKAPAAPAGRLRAPAGRRGLELSGQRPRSGSHGPGALAQAVSSVHGARPGARGRGFGGSRHGGLCRRSYRRSLRRPAAEGVSGPGPGPGGRGFASGRAGVGGGRPLATRGVRVVTPVAGERQDRPPHLPRSLRRKRALRPRFAPQPAGGCLRHTGARRFLPESD